MPGHPGGAEPEMRSEFMILIEETPVPQSALPVVGFRDHLRLGSGFADDGLQDAALERFLRAALAAIEARTGKILIEREFSWTLGQWRGATCQPLPVAPVNALLSVAMIDRAGAETQLAATACTLRQDAVRPQIESGGVLLPTIPQGGSVRISFRAGFGPGWDDLPAELGQAVMLLAAHYYEYRHEAAFSGSAMPYGVSALIERHRTLRLSSRGTGA